MWVCAGYECFENERWGKGVIGVGWGSWAGAYLISNPAHASDDKEEDHEGDEV